MEQHTQEKENQHTNKHKNFQETPETKPRPVLSNTFQHALQMPINPPDLVKYPDHLHLLNNNPVFPYNAFF